MITRTISGVGTYNLSYDAENHLSGVSGAATASIVYDGDGKRVKGTVGSTTTTYLGNYFEWTGSTSTMKKSYYAGEVRIAMRTGSGTGTSGLLYLFGDHLGSASRVANPDGTPYTGGEQRYKPWGEQRYPAGASTLPTTFQFTGQRVESGLSLYYYGARWYDPYLARFVQADTIVPNPGQPMSWDRYMYVLGNPLKYVDPTGYTSACWQSYSDPECKKEDNWHPLHFIKLPVNLKNITWIQWFGGTKFAKNDGDAWNYDGYCQGYHCGLDIGTEEWGESVHAGVNGIVVGAWGTDNPAEVFGPYRVDIQVGDYRLIYGHLDGNLQVMVGDIVSPDTILAGVGNPSGDPKLTNTHLHLEIRSPYSINGWMGEKLISNPLMYMNEKTIAGLVNISLVQDDKGTVDFANGLSHLEQPIIHRGWGSLWE
jgi:RHS repeat-associated protein